VFLLICVAVGLQPILAQEPAEEKLAITHGPYLQHVTDNSAIIIWFTNKKCVSHVEHGTGDNFQTFPRWGSLMATARDVRHGLVAANNKRHVVRIKGLESGKSYRYRLVSKEMIQFEPYEVLFGDTVVSDIYKFKTLDPAKQAFSVFFFQDIHGDAERLDGMLQRLPLDEVDMVFFNGDTVSYLTGEDSLFQGFLDVSVDRFAKEKPFLYIRGNHDTRGDFARNLMDYFPPREGNYFYSFTHGPAHFLVLDSGEDKPDDSPVYAGLTAFDAYREMQAKWLKQEIQTEAFKNARFRIAVFHIPPAREGRHVSDEIRRLWVPLFNEGGLDVLFSGHHHRYSHHDPQAGKFDFPIIVGPAQGVVRVDVSEEQINVRVESTTGEIMDSFVLKPNQQ
jgi:predicted phosphodiesterase